MDRNLVQRVLTFMLLVALLLAACGQAATEPPATEVPEATDVTEPEATEPPETEEEPEQVTLRIIDNWGGQPEGKGPPFDSILADFREAYPNIVVEEEVFTDEQVPDRVNTAFLAGEEPDIVLNNYWAPTRNWLNDGVTIDVGPLLDEWGLRDQFKDVALQQYTNSEGQVQAFPLEGFIWPMWYNMRILEESGVDGIPQTIDELIQASELIRAAGYEPLVVGGSDWTGRALFEVITESVMTHDEVWEVWGGGGFADNPNAVAGVELFTQLRDAGVFAEGSEGLEFSSRNEVFFAGEAAMMYGGSWAFPSCPEEICSDVVLGGFPLPEGSPHEHPVIRSAFYGKGVWITRNGANNLDAVEKFVTFLFQPEMIARLVEQSAIIPPLVEVPVDESVLNPLFAEALGLGDSTTVVETMGVVIPESVFADVERISRLAFLPDTSSEELITQLDQAYQSALASR